MGESIIVTFPGDAERRQAREVAIEQFYQSTEDLLVASFGLDAETETMVVEALAAEIVKVADHFTEDDLRECPWGQRFAATMRIMSRLDVNTDPIATVIDNRVASTWTKAWTKVVETQAASPMPSLFFGMHRSIY
jgi:hypothetical protein